jgi:hypothetical protein
MASTSLRSVSNPGTVPAAPVHSVVDGGLSDPAMTRQLRHHRSHVSWPDINPNSAPSAVHDAYRIVPGKGG